MISLDSVWTWCYWLWWWWWWLGGGGGEGWRRMKTWRRVWYQLHGGIKAPPLPVGGDKRWKHESCWVAPAPGDHSNLTSSLMWKTISWLPLSPLKQDPKKPGGPFLLFLTRTHNLSFGVSTQWSWSKGGTSEAGSNKQFGLCGSHNNTERSSYISGLNGVALQDFLFTLGFRTN